MKKLFTLLILLASAITINAGNFAATNNPTLKIDSIQAAPETEVSIPMFADFTNVSGGIGSLTLFVNFDPDIAQFVGIENIHSNFTDTVYAVIIENKYLLIAWYTITNPLTLSGKLFDLKFNYQSGSTDIWFDVNRCLLSDNAAMPIANISYTNGAINQQDPTGVNHPRKPFLVYPNPASSTINLPESTHVQLLNTSGQLIYCGTTKIVDLTGLPSGIYYIIHAQGVSKVSKL